MQTVCIQGLGFVGVAMASAIADIKDKNENPLYQVYGVELDNPVGRERVNNINKGYFPFKCEDDSLIAAFENSVVAGNLIACHDEHPYSLANIVIVDINLDISVDKSSINMEPFKNAIKTLGNKIQQDTLVIIETTVPPGTCKNVVLPILRECFIHRGLNENRILLAHSYERVMPGKDYLSSIKNFWRVYSATTTEAEEKCEAFLKTLINVDQFPLTKLDSTTESETAKVMENSYRAVNIAFVEEWSNFANVAGIDLYKVIEAIRVRPTHSNIMHPGFGVGGYCLTKDPLFAYISSEEIFHNKIDFPFCRLAVKTNDEMPLTAYRVLKYKLKDIANKKVLVLGASYRQDVGDTRCSPSAVFIKQLLHDGAFVSVHDSYVTYWNEMSMDIHKEIPLLHRFDAVVFAVSHKEYKSMDLKSLLPNKSIIVLDANNVLTSAQRGFIKQNNIDFVSLGRG